MPFCSIEPKVMTLRLCSQSNDIYMHLSIQPHGPWVEPGAKSLVPRSAILDIDGSNRVQGMTWFWINMIEPLHNG